MLFGIDFNVSFQHKFLNFMQWPNNTFSKHISKILAYKNLQFFSFLLFEWRKKKEEPELGKEKDVNKIQVSSYQMYQGSRHSLQLTEDFTLPSIILITSLDCNFSGWVCFFLIHVMCCLFKKTDTTIMCEVVNP